MNYSFPEKAMLIARKTLNSFIFTKKTNTELDKAIVSFTFDDVPRCTFDYALPILDKHAVKATFYVAGNLVKDENAKCLTVEQISSLIEKGHEIGCHTYSHIKSGKASAKVYEQDLLKNKKYFADNFKLALENFSYPNGSVGLWNKPLVNRTFASARTTCFGINVNPVDLGFLLAYKLYSSKMNQDDIDALINLAVKLKGWLIFYSHDVCPQPAGGGCKPELLEYAISRAVHSGAYVLNIKQALAKILK